MLAQSAGFISLPHPPLYRAGPVPGGLTEIVGLRGGSGRRQLRAQNGVAVPL